ncbi:DUF3080 family protein [Vibrio sp. 10N.286.49.B1]|uniref:DUF3080 family protein n=1 Tax=unclassified Vibrio TaxID=2614977 RepID=UPI000C84D1AB|nr:MULTISPECIES: DUF3080 family protein [unclassified Vibrio]
MRNKVERANTQRQVVAMSARKIANKRNSTWCNVRRHLMVWMTTSIALSGCFQPDTMTETFTDYQRKVASIQERPLLAPPETSLVLLPGKRDMLQAIPVTTLGIVDTYQLRQCQLFGIIAERNSSLGKVQDAFRNFDYQIQLIEGLERCIGSSQIDSALKQDLQVILGIKYRYLSKHFYNLLFTSDAMRTQLNSSGWLEPTSGSVTMKVKPSLLALNDITESIAQLESDGVLMPFPPFIMPFQETLEKNPVIGNLAYSLQASTQWLDAVTRQLSQYDSAIVCGEHRDTTRFNYLVNVFNQVFIAKIQPYLSFLDSEYRVVSGELRFIEAASKYNKADSVYDVRALYHQFSLSNREHVNYWQALFSRCGKTLRDVRNH